MIGRIFLPSGFACLTRGPYILAYVLLHVIYFAVAFNVDEFLVPLVLCMLLYTYLKVNINAQRGRDSGLKARYVVILSVLIYLGCAVMGFFFGDDCASLAVRINIGFDLLVFFMFLLAPTQLKTTN
ncbi:hypothetical protein AAEY27_21205 [Kosakonia sp. BYX6]|uniref:Uncharacterized protein n=1 Tax=Kosakonia calanthes TaxID=3139408 RepID=A0ABZ3BD29_9ENTR